MLRISKSQQKALDRASLESYVKELSERLAERNPELAQTMDEPHRDAAVRKGVHAALEYGFTNRGPIRMYFDLCVIFGSGFVEDPMYPWAAEIIGEPDPETQTERAEALFSESKIAVEKIYGPEDAYSLAALHALSAWAHNFTETPATGLEEYTLQQMQSIHPEKAEYGGPDALRQLFRDAKAFCRDLEVAAPRPVVLMTALKFAFGAGCFDDPLYGWIRSTLTREKIPDMAVRFERLERRALTWLDAVINNQV